MIDREPLDELTQPEQLKLERDARVREIIAEIRAKLRGEKAKS